MMIDRKNNRFMTLCFILFAISSLVNKSYIDGFAAMAAVYASMCCDTKKQQLLYTLAAGSWVPSLRIFGVVGYLLEAMGKTELANPLLAYHWGLIAIDDNSLSPIGRLAASGLALSFAM
ncbi:hypothetical protein FK949_gp179 [Paramecium bursaria Chlorella virus NYs1]|uniref:Uncharacterized protein n=1 Tax=Paramecium bursaria Chlorella virus NYs1 TaxID=83442 RepID=M1I896_9PHYC|nr:hypothetical protein FK949_gp179 [Paramecium bursaria Chlorella virus NYs1]AGE58744.1 hypothetical protein PBCVNYs1_465R [Paramecium bursaria Chlorella virus NYs1]